MRTVLPRHTRLDTPTCTRGQGRPPAMPRARQLWADPPQSRAIPLTMSRPYERHIPTGTGLQLYPPRIAIIYSRTHRNRARFCPQRPRAHPFPAPLVCGQVYLESEITHRRAKYGKSLHTPAHRADSSVIPAAHGGAVHDGRRMVQGGGVPSLVQSPCPSVSR